MSALLHNAKLQLQGAEHHFAECRALQQERQAEAQAARKAATDARRHADAQYKASEKCALFPAGCIALARAGVWVPCAGKRCRICSCVWTHSRQHARQTRRRWQTEGVRLLVVQNTK